MNLRSMVICISCLITKIEETDNTEEKNGFLKDIEGYFNQAISLLETKPDIKNIKAIKSKLFTFLDLDVVDNSIGYLNKFVAKGY